MRFALAFWATVTIVTVGTLLLCSKSEPFLGGLFFVPFAFGPLAVTIGLAFALRSTVAQYLLTVSSVLYGVWFAFVYTQAVYVNPDPQSPIAFLFIGIYAFPVLALFWITAAVAHWRKWKWTPNQRMHARRPSGLG